ncbi:orotidine-5'-phosphate decarboxylase [Peribacillus deserti]|uniref:Orotidine 5'-phosphate decarboxylase n=1 Tax=Peribacillus deserti TaxID=673318 RepID=A0ABS2QII1_9BACI|nr:orotidine-5'-phosphate decarboxylase [Peribacillus deserti]MBM7692333.1 orotidine-5'-phosphate decarboxylase [Peribacillus deserti]
MNFLPIIALDFPDKKRAGEFLDRFSDESLFVKVGMELYYQNGPEILSFIKERGHKIFLDIKLHDIPNTVGQAMKGLASLEADMVNLHAAGGKDMMVRALEGLEAGTAAGKKRPLCIAVTQLTSTSEDQMQNEQLIHVSLEQSVLHYAKLAREAGLDGVVCSTHEVEAIHRAAGNSFITVTPGIRTAGGDLHDQKRIATPEQARLLGTNAIVVGRSITQSADPYQAYLEIKSAWEGVIA